MKTKMDKTKLMANSEMEAVRFPRQATKTEMSKMVKIIAIMKKFLFL